jgi:hypothetical protein
MIRALAIFAFATPAAAFEIDYAQVFAANPDAIAQTGASTRRLDLPPNVHVVETTHSDGSISYFGYDDGQAGAAGCTFDILIDLTVVTRLCPHNLGPDALTALSANLHAAATFFAANTVPPIPDTDIPARLEAHVKARAAELSQTALQCDPEGDPQLLPVVRAATNPAFRQTLNLIFAEPRLPVSNPCM